jgi:tRNA pseudouridine32 synthase / 23S rRNA pseudouridine746 synthase
MIKKQADDDTIQIRNPGQANLPSPLPMRDGISPSYVWLPDGSWKNILDFLDHRFPDIARSVWLTRMNKGELVDANGLRFTPETPYRRGACLFYYREIDNETPIPFEEVVLYRDKHILVVDKPHFLPVIPSGRFLRETLLVRLKHKFQLEHLVPIHRLDRETAGVIIFSHQPESRGNYQSLFQKRLIVKTYEAVAPTNYQHDFPLIYKSRMVEGTPFFRMQETEGLPNSETQIEVIENRGACSLYRLMPVTGKKHQLRVHLAALGIPIINDTFYPDVFPCKGDDISLPLQLLAKAISFIDPITGEKRYFESTRKI